MLSLTIADFVEVLGISNKVEDRQLQPAVDAVRTLELVSLLGWPVLEAVAALPAATITPYAPGLPAQAQQLVLRGERVYRALSTGVSATTIPLDGSSTAAWLYEPLLTLWTQYLRPYWLREAYARFLPNHGVEIAKAGMTKPSAPDGTFVATTSADRAATVAAAQAQADAYRARLTAFLASETHANRYDYGRAAATGCAPATTSRRTGLRGINNARHARAY